MQSILQVDGGKAVQPGSCASKPWMHSVARIRIGHGSRDALFVAMSVLIFACWLIEHDPSGDRLSPSNDDCWFASGSLASSAECWSIFSVFPVPPSWLKLPQQRTGSTWS